MGLSTYSKISNAISPTIRNFLDLHIKKMGSNIELLRIKSDGVKDIHGVEKNAYLKQNSISNAVIDYPLGEVELYDQTKDNELDVTSIHLQDILPINLWTTFNTVDGEEIIDLERGDYLVHVLRDHRRNKIAVKLQVERLVGSFMDTNITTLQYEVSLVRGLLKDEIEDLIKVYVGSLE